MTSAQIISFVGTVLAVVARDLIGYAAARRQWVNAMDAGQIDLPPKPTFDIPLFLISLFLGILAGLTVFGVNVTVAGQ